ncbi:serine hydrolase [Algibacter mikhailovii]|uniref:serine hydrolase n=1 Tax=Algibacter mikhailovii TaxID=425498 RepID=UPI0024947FA9|nr:serine hydrolase [Algibacter mikhailovii]
MKTNKLRYSLYLLLVMFVYVAKAQPELPIKNQVFSPLNTHKSIALQQHLQEELFANPKWKKLLDTKKMTIAVVDLKDSSHVKYAGINDDYMMYSASLPKIAILFAVMHAIENNEVADTERLKADLRLMISKSSNSAATKMIDLVGYEKIDDVLQRSEIPLYNKDTGGGLWVGKRYASSGRRYPDPLKGLSHAATAYQAANFYYLIVYGELINYARSKEMLDILKDPKLNHKLVNTISSIAPNATLYRKSGTWKSYHSDSILVWGPDRRYILVVLIEDAQGEQIIRNVVKPVELAIQRSKSANSE